MSTFPPPEPNPKTATSQDRTERKIRFAPRDKVKKAGQWALKKYASVFKKLAE